VNLLDRLAWLRPAAVNTALAAMLIAALAVDLQQLGDRGGNWVFELISGLTVVVLAVLRSRRLLWFAVAGVAVCVAAEIAALIWTMRGQPGPAAYAGLLVLLAASIRSLPARQAAAIAVATALTAAGAMIRHPDVAVVVGLACCVAAAAGLVLRLLDTRRQWTLDNVRRDERLELARELHDAAAHHLTAMVIQAQAARLAAARKPEVLDEVLADIESAGTDALAAMRRVIGLLRDSADGASVSTGPEQLSDLRGQLGELTSRFARRGPEVSLRLPAELGWPAEMSTTIYRVVQEALTNVARHAAGAAAVTVSLASDEREITVEVTDDAPAGSSPRFAPGSGYGLAGMRERVEALGGRLTAGPRPVAGWSVLATLPAPAAP
jgi:signal transduction histidine kinase